MSAQRGLGRGLDSLIPTEVTADMPAAVQPTRGDAVVEVPVGAVKPNPHQPRTQFDATELQGLADSIKQHGIVHPPVVSQVGEGYELIAGERRLRAAKLAGLATIPVIIRSYDEQQKLELALLENVQRAQLNPIESALAYRKLAGEFNLSLDQISERMGKAKTTVANTMRLLSLPKAALEAVATGIISEAHGRAILALESSEQQAQLLQRIITEKLSVRQAEAAVQAEKGIQKAAPTKPPASPSAPSYSEHEIYIMQELADRLDSKVVLQPAQSGAGKLVVDYASKEELERIVNLIKAD